ncbi:VOC family protein [Schlesneria sp. T3-172]|uniref:VOC family protein n=1 Tax=Schlesneria sphaerica TaxID=3373610 RepID=UPI0037C73859
MSPSSEQSSRPDENSGTDNPPCKLSIETIVETAIYGDCLDELERFYTDVMNLPVMAKETGRHVFFSAGPSSVLLVFNPQTTLQGHVFPPHGATGPGHVAFGVRHETLDAWRAKLQAHEIEIEKEHHWPKGGISLYLRDPAGNSVELITPGVWGTPAGW